jgi:hypothetical protein
MTEPRRRGKADPLKKLRKAALKTIREKGEQIAEKLLELDPDSPPPGPEVETYRANTAPELADAFSRLRTLGLEHEKNPN